MESDNRNFGFFYVGVKRHWGQVLKYKVCRDGNQGQTMFQVIPVLAGPEKRQASCRRDGSSYLESMAAERRRKTPGGYRGHNTSSAWLIEYKQ
jgi:hypothetical protein